MVRPLVTGTSKIAELSGSIPLDNDEKDSGALAFSALLYQYGGQIDARVLVGLWLASVSIPRVIHHLQQRENSKKQLRVRLVGNDSITRGINDE